MMVPVVTAVKALEASDGVPIIPAPPDKTTQLVSPEVGVVADNTVVAELIHSVWLLPVTAKGPCGSTTIATVDRFEPHEPFVTVHCRILIPELKAETLLLNELIFPNVADPCVTDHDPIPAVGGVAANIVVALLIQSTCVVPALATDGKASTCILMVAEFEQPPFEIVHFNIFNPTPNPITVLPASVGLVTVPPKAVMIDQVAVPNVGVLAASVVLFELIHNVWLTPTVANCARLSTCMVTDEELGAQTPFEMVHCNMFVPAARLVADEVASVGVTT